MTLLMKIPHHRLGMKISSLLNTCEFLSPLKRALASYPKSFPSLSKFNSDLTSTKVSVLALNRSQAQILCSRVLLNSCHQGFFRKGNRSLLFVNFFHTTRVSTEKLGTEIRGSPSKNKSALIYIVAIFVLMLGGAYAGVPLYKVFCQATGLGGQAIREKDLGKIEDMERVEREIKVRFNADVASSMRWNFKPQQTEVTVLPGETALAFYTAKNPTDRPIIGISTYNVIPLEAGQYFNKIQCFCFEEQRLNPNEQVDMPVFFYIDPEFAEDPKLESVDTIHLSYTFFEAVDGLTLPLPGYPQPHDPVVSSPTPMPAAS